jgi:hypothetical protein
MENRVIIFLGNTLFNYENQACQTRIVFEWFNAGFFKIAPNLIEIVKL